MALEGLKLAKTKSLLPMGTWRNSRTGNHKTVQEEQEQSKTQLQDAESLHLLHNLKCSA